MERLQHDDGATSLGVAGDGIAGNEAYPEPGENHGSRRMGAVHGHLARNLDGGAPTVDQERPSVSGAVEESDNRGVDVPQLVGLRRSHTGGRRRRVDSGTRRSAPASFTDEPIPGPGRSEHPAESLCEDREPAGRDVTVLGRFDNVLPDEVAKPVVVEALRSSPRGVHRPMVAGNSGAKQPRLPTKHRVKNRDPWEPRPR